MSQITRVSGPWAHAALRVKHTTSHNDNGMWDGHNNSYERVIWGKKKKKLSPFQQLNLKKARLLTRSAATWSKDLRGCASKIKGLTKKK